MVDLIHLHPEFKRRAVGLQDETQCGFRSAYRSSEEQAYLYNHQGQPGIGPANPPGTSNHEAIPYGDPMGLAIDFILPDGWDDWDEFHRIAENHQLHFPIPHEPWHGQPVEVTESYYTGMPTLSVPESDELDEEEQFFLLVE